MPLMILHNILGSGSRDFDLKDFVSLLHVFRACRVIQWNRSLLCRTSPHLVYLIIYITSEHLADDIPV